MIKFLSGGPGREGTGGPVGGARVAPLRSVGSGRASGAQGWAVEQLCYSRLRYAVIHLWMLFSIIQSAAAFRPASPIAARRAGAVSMSIDSRHPSEVRTR